MNVLWTHNFNPEVGGSGVFMRTFANALADYGVNIELMYLGRLNSPMKLNNARDRVRKLSIDFDIVHSQFGSACAYVSGAAVVHKIVSLRGSDWHLYRGPDFREMWHGVLANLFTRACLPSFDAIITMSNRMTGGVRRSWPDMLVKTLPDPVDTKLFSPMDRSEARFQLAGTTSTAPWVLFTTLSASNPIKRVHLAREAVSIASTDLEGLELKVANNIPHDLMPLFVASCDLTLCTSTHEGWPNSVKEGLACGLPFVSTDVSDLHLIANRNNGCIICDPDVEMLADALVSSLKKGRNPSLRDEVKFMEVDSSCRQLVSFYESVLSRSKNSEQMV